MYVFRDFSFIKILTRFSFVFCLTKSYPYLIQIMTSYRTSELIAYEKTIFLNFDFELCIRESLNETISYTKLHLFWVLQCQDVNFSKNIHFQVLCKIQIFWEIHILTLQYWKFMKFCVWNSLIKAFEYTKLQYEVQKYVSFQKLLV